MSAFLMGCRDKDGQWRAVAKVGTGFSDEMLKDVNSTLAACMVKTDNDAARLPSWIMLGGAKHLMPDYVISDPDNVAVCAGF